jgi:exonuclease V
MGQPATPAPADADLSGDEYGTDIEYDVELETLVQAVESQVGRSVAAGRDEGAEAAPAAPPDQLMDIEDAAVTLASPFERFRKKGWLSVSDLVGTVWCEVQVRADLVPISLCLLRVADESYSMTSQLILIGSRSN